MPHGNHKEAILSHALSGVHSSARRSSLLDSVRGGFKLLLGGSAVCNSISKQLVTAIYLLLTHSQIAVVRVGGGHQLRRGHRTADSMNIGLVVRHSQHGGVYANGDRERVEEGARPAHLREGQDRYPESWCVKSVLLRQPGENEAQAYLVVCRIFGPYVSRGSES